MISVILIKLFIKLYLIQLITVLRSNEDIDHLNFHFRISTVFAMAWATLHTPHRSKQTPFITPIPILALFVAPALFNQPNTKVPSCRPWPIQDYPRDYNKQNPIDRRTDGPRPRRFDSQIPSSLSGDSRPNDNHRKKKSFTWKTKTKHSS